MEFFGDHPSVWIGVAILCAAYVGAAMLAQRRPTSRQAMWFTLATLTILWAHGQIDELSDQRLFFMHMFQHLLQALVIPPMLLLGTPDWMLRPWLLSRAARPIARIVTQPVVAFLLFAAIFCTAHLPAVFDRMCRDEDFHIAVHVAFMAAGVIMWWPILSPLPELPRLSYPGQVLYLFLLMIPMTAVAAPITLAYSVTYPWYTEGPHAWGIKPMDDQILGGLLMWVGQGTYLMAIFTAIFYRWARRDDQDMPEYASQTLTAIPH